MPDEQTGVIESGQETAVETPAPAAVDPVLGSDSGYQQGETEESVQTPDPAVEGRIEAVQAIRAEKQQLQAELEMIRRENEQYRQWVIQQQQQSAPKPEEEFPFQEDDYLNAGQIKELLQAQKSQFETQRQQEIREHKEQQMVKNFQEYQKTIPDFLETFTLAGEMIRSDPNFRNFDKALEMFPDPVMAAYNLGKLHPNYQAKQTATTTSKVVDQIQRNLKQPQTLTNSGGAVSPSLDKAAMYANMTDDEILAEIRKRKGFSA